MRSSSGSLVIARPNRASCAKVPSRTPRSTSSRVWRAAPPRPQARQAEPLRPQACRSEGLAPSRRRSRIARGNRMTDRMPAAGVSLALLAGDRDGATHWLEGLLESGGYGVLRERTGRDALQRARATRPDLVIVDAELSDQAGVELCRALRADPRVTTSTPILLAAGEPCTRERRIAALADGAWECIAPPHDADEILLKVQAYVRAKLDADRGRAEGLLDPLSGLYNPQGLARGAGALGSQAFREHGALACVAVALDGEHGGAAAA